MQTVKQQRADLLITDGPQLSFWCALFAVWQNIKVHHIATSFHFAKLPTGIPCWLQQWVFSRINKFTVYSRAERQIYSQHFAIPIARLEMVYLAASIQETVMPERAPQQLSSTEASRTRDGRTENYLCAFSETEMDFLTLMAAMKELPHIPLVAVVKSFQQKGCKPPANVKLLSDATLGDRLELLRHARFLLLPQRHTQMPCDCATLVTAMQFGKAFVVPDLAGVNDYAFNNSNGLLYKPGKSESLAAAIADLWEHPLKREVLAENGQEFAEKFCSRVSTYKYFRQLLVQRGL